MLPSQNVHLNNNISSAQDLNEASAVFRISLMLGQQGLLIREYIDD